MAIKNKSFEEIERIYNIEMEKIVKTIKKENAKKILLQFPEGMKPYSQVISDEIEKKTEAVCIISLDSCYGACDLPLENERLGIDLIIQFGHSKWNFKDKRIKVIKN